MALLRTNRSFLDKLLFDDLDKDIVLSCLRVFGLDKDALLDEPPTTEPLADDNLELLLLLFRVLNEFFDDVPSYLFLRL
jgi:hypothetical protein